MRVSKLNKVSDADFKEMVSLADSIHDLEVKLGYRKNSGPIFYQIRGRIKELGLDTSHFGVKARKRSADASVKHSLDSILVLDSTYTNIARLKLRLRDAGLLVYACECGNTGEWLGKELKLQLDHKNGDPRDHRISNLRFICPNCHTQTDNFAGRNKANP